MSPISSLSSVLLLSLLFFSPSISATSAGYRSPQSELSWQRRSLLLDEAGQGYPDTFSLSARAPRNNGRPSTNIDAMKLRRRDAILQARQEFHSMQAREADILPSGSGSGSGSVPATGQPRAKSGSGPGAGTGAGKGQTQKMGGMSSRPCVSSYASSMANGGMDPCAGSSNVIMAPKMAVP